MSILNDPVLSEMTIPALEAYIGQLKRKLKNAEASDRPRINLNILAARYHLGNLRITRDMEPAGMEQGCGGKCNTCCVRECNEEL